MSNELTQSRLKQALNYNPDSGVFTWLEKVSLKVVVGARAGQLRQLGYRAVGLFGERYLEHRLAVLYMTGEWPADSVDHRDGVPGNNRWSNLRVCTHLENHQNRRPIPGRTAPPGVGWHTLRKKWRATVTVRGVQHHLGLFDTVAEAVAVRAEAKARLHPFNPTQRI